MGKIFDFFKREIQLNKEYYAKEEIDSDSKKFDNLFHPSDDCIYLVYEFGHLFKVYPVPTCPYNYYINIVRDASFIISDGIQYDLSCKQAILSIEIPGYDVHLKSKIDKEIGRASSLEFVLREKGDKYWRQRNYDLAIACYGKATQLMAFSDDYWDDVEFYLIVRKLDELGKHNHADKWRIWLNNNVFSLYPEDNLSIEILRKCDPVDDETALVLNVTEEDMKSLTGFSYDLDCHVEKFIKEGTHPYAYIRLNRFNQAVANKDLYFLSDIIKEYPGYSSKFSLDVRKIEYSEYSPSCGYSVLVCTPKTPTGKIAKYPLSLSFMSRMDVYTYQCLGKIKYLNDGTIATAEVHIWRRKSFDKPANGRSYYFKVIDGELQIYKVDSHD